MAAPKWGLGRRGLGPQRAGAAEGCGVVVLALCAFRSCAALFDRQSVQMLHSMSPGRSRRGSKRTQYGSFARNARHSLHENCPGSECPTGQQSDDTLRPHLEQASKRKQGCFAKGDLRNLQESCKLRKGSS